MSNSTSLRRSAAQIRRSEERDTAGRFVKNPCECCSKGAPVHDFYSDVRDGAQLMVLCKRCADRLAVVSDEDFATIVRISEWCRYGR